MFFQLRKIKLIIVISLVFLGSCSESKSDAEGSDVIVIHHLKFDWRIKENSDDFYKTTTALYESFKNLNVEIDSKGLRGITLNSEYGNFSGIDIHISPAISFNELKENLAKISNEKVTVEIGANTLKYNVLMTFYDVPTSGIFLRACKLYEMKNFKNAIEAYKYMLKIQGLSLRKAFLFFTYYEYQETIKRYKFEYKFYGNCDFKEKILKELENGITM